MTPIHNILVYTHINYGQKGREKLALETTELLTTPVPNTLNKMGKGLSQNSPETFGWARKIFRTNSLFQVGEKRPHNTQLLTNWTSRHVGW